MSEPLRVVASRYCLEFHRCSPPNGQCVQQGRAEFCRCRIGFQGVDCAEVSISSTISPSHVTPGSTAREINAHYKPSLPTHHPIVSSRFPVASSINRTLNEYVITATNDSLATKESVRQLVHEILPPPSYYIHPDSTLLPPPSIDSDGGSTVFAGLACLLGIIVCGGTVVFVWQLLQKLFTTRATPVLPGPRAVMSRRSAMKAEKKEAEEKKEEKKEEEEEESEKDALLEDPVAMSKVQWNQ